MILLCLSFGLSSILPGCKKPTTEEETKNYRKDVFNCLINETRWNPAHMDEGYVKAYIINSDASGYYVTLDAGSNKKTMAIHLAGIKLTKSPTTYTINQNVPQNVLDIFVYTMYPDNFGYVDDLRIDSNNFKWHKCFLTSAEKTGEVTITKFTMEPAPQAGTYHGVIAGIFHFNTLHKETNETIAIRDGNFEVEYWK
jgi:hypothetical protein